MTRRKVKRGGYTDALGFQLGSEVLTMLDKKHLLPPDVRMGTTNCIATWPSSHCGHQLQAWHRFSWPEERRIYSYKRGHGGNTSIFCMHFCRQRAVCRFKRRTLWKMHHFHQQNFYYMDGIARASAFKAAIINYLWCSEENIFLLRMMTNHSPKWITFWSIGHESFLYELFSALLTEYSLKNIVHWKLRYPNCCDSFFWYFQY